MRGFVFIFRSGSVRNNIVPLQEKAMQSVPTYHASIITTTPDEEFFKTLTKYDDTFGEGACEKKTSWGYSLETP
jgi:hypothetical protein